MRWLFNTLTVWFLTGIWHGADWTFILWGVYFAIFLVLEKFILNKFFAKIPRVFSHVYVIVAILVSFVLFHGNGLAGSLADIGHMFGAGSLPFWSAQTTYYLISYIFVLLVSLVGATPVVKHVVLKIKSPKRGEAIVNILEPVFVLGILFVVTAYFVDGSFSPFLYFRF